MDPVKEKTANQNIKINTSFSNHNLEFSPFISSHSSGSISSAFPGDGFPEQSLLLQSEQGSSSRDTMLDFSGMDQNQQLSLIDNQDTYLQVIGLID